MKRLETPTIKIGNIKIGGGNPVIIQSMTNTDTSDVDATVQQSIDLAKAGSEIIRLTINTQFAAQAIPHIRKKLDQQGYNTLPIIGDFHFNGHKLLRDYPEMAATIDKYRINPGNLGIGDKHDKNFETIIKIAIKNKKAIRIGVNGGSLDEELLTKMMDENSPSPFVNAIVESAWQSAQMAEKLGLANDKIILSLKTSDLQETVKSYEQITERMQKENKYYALHLGLTEAGSGIQGIVSSAAALSILLQKGIGDTIRVSITPNKNTPRSQEVEVCKQLLQSMGFRYFKPKITSCPGCGRTSSTFFQDLAASVNQAIEEKLPIWKEKYKEVEKLKISIMGCIVNGPGEAKHSDIAIALPGKMEKNLAPVYIKGKYIKSLESPKILEKFIEIIEEYLAENF